MAEVVGMREVLRWLKNQHVTQVQVETDADLFVEGLKRDGGLSTFDLILDDIKEIAKCFGSINFLFAKRSAKMAAHLLARDAISRPGRMEWNSVPFPALFDVLMADNA